MPLIFVARATLSLISLAILALGAYLIWSWYDGVWIIEPLGGLHRERDDWRLIAAAGLLAVSFLGRWPLLLLLGRPDAIRTRPIRSDGEMVVSPTGSKLYIERHGPPDAPRVILSHGWGLDSTIWFYLRRALATRFQVITWDLPGLGKSKATSLNAVGLKTFALDLKFLLSLDQGRPTMLVGHSIGGMTIQTLIRDHPGVMETQVAGIVLVNTTYTNPLKTMLFSPLALALRWPLLEPLMRLAIWLNPLAWLLAWQGYLNGSAHLANRLGFAGQVTRSQLEHTTLLATRNSPAVLAKGNLAMFRWEADGALQEITVPALVIAGDSDIVTKVEASQVLARATPGGELNIIPQANHMGFLERFSDYGQVIGEFCDRCVSPADDRPPRAAG